MRTFCTHYLMRWVIRVEKIIWFFFNLSRKFDKPNANRHCQSKHILINVSSIFFVAFCKIFFLAKTLMFYSFIISVLFYVKITIFNDWLLISFFLFVYLWMPIILLISEYRTKFENTSTKIVKILSFMINLVNQDHKKN